MDIECVFVFSTAIIASIIGGYVTSSRIDARLWDSGEQIFFSAMAAVISALAGLLLGAITYNAPLVVLGLLTWGLVIRYTVIRGLRKNSTKYPI